MERYRVLSHTADAAFEAEGASLDRLIENLAYGMFDLMFDLANVASERPVEAVVCAPMTEDLVVDVLADLLYEAETGDLAFSSFSVRTDEKGTHARVVAAGSAASGQELRGPPIKATYHDLEVSPRVGGWYGRVVFDV